MSDLIVSMATISERLPLLPGVLQSLLAQSRAPDRILVWISEEPYLLDRGVARRDLPPAVERLVRRGEVELRTAPNVGPHRKLLPLLEILRREGRDARIVTADDDTAYPVRWLAALEAAHRETGAAVCFRARRIGLGPGGLAPYHTWTKIPSHEEVLGDRLLPTGKDGLLLRPAMLDERVFGREYRRLCPSRSDAWIGAALLSRGTRILKLSTQRLFPDPSGLEPGTGGELAPPPAAGPPGAAPLRAPGPSLTEFNRARNDLALGRTFAFFGLAGRTSGSRDAPSVDPEVGRPPVGLGAPRNVPGR